MTSRRIINNLSTISPTLNSKLILLNRIKNNLPVYNGGLGENPLPTPEYLLDTMKRNISKKEWQSIHPFEDPCWRTKWREGNLKSYIIKKVDGNID